MKPSAPAPSAAIRAALLGVALAALGLVAAPAGAVSPKYFLHDTATELARGDIDGVAIDADGSLRLAPEVETLAESEEAYVWDVAVDPARGDAYVATGDDGWILRWRSGRLERFFQCAALEVLSLAVDADGRVWAGTAPEGFVYRIEPDGTGEIVLDAEEPYVWDLAPGPDGVLWAGVGPKGAVYRIDRARGTSRKLASVEDHHVVSVAAHPQGGVVVGTEGRGLVLRIDTGGTVRVLHDTPQGEVGAVLVAADGTVWAAAAATAQGRETATAMDSADGTAPGDGDDKDEPDDYSFDFRPAGAGDGVLYRIAPDGDVVRLWESGQGTIFDLAMGPDGRVLAATGDRGALWSVDADGGATLLHEDDAEQVVALAPDGSRGGWLMGTSNPPALRRVGRSAASEGTYESEVLDAGRPATWGRAEWTGEGDGVRLDFRSGGTDEPDGTWTDWLEGGRGPSVELARAGNARFLQWRLTLRGGDDGPIVRRVRVSALESNAAPILSSVEVVPSGLRFFDDVPELRPRPLWQALPGGVKVQYQFDNGGDSEYPPEQRAPWTQGMRQVRWQAVDPNQDFLLFTLAYKREDETRWKDFAEDVDGKQFTFNSNGVPDGFYRIRVTASDERFNPAAPRTASRASEPFLVDNSSPAFEDVKHRRDGDSVRIEGVAADALSDVVRLEVSVDGGDWTDERPADGLFDAPREAFATTVEVAPGEEHSILLRATDLAGNLGTVRVLLRP